MAPGSDRPTVLITDDNEFMRKRIGEVLSGAGYEVVGEAGDGLESVALFGSLKPDLVTMDLVMPDMDGIEAIRKILDLDGYARILVISSVGSDDKIDEAIGAGATEFVVKPFHDDRLIEVAGQSLAEAGRMKLLKQKGTWLSEEEASAIEARAQASVLVVDDSAAMRAKLVDILKLGGFGRVDEAEDGEQAVQAYEALRPTVVTMDLVMPNKDGMEAIADIMQLDADARIVVCSAMADDARVTAALNAGAREFLVKPYQVDSVVDVISAILPRPA
jgi:two-component system, chemotaxis family, chemotaxis protein CheY